MIMLNLVQGGYGFVFTLPEYENSKKLPFFEVIFLQTFAP